MKFFIVYLAIVCISCANIIEEPSNSVFQINKSISVSGILKSGYVKNKDGFPLLAKTIGDTLFMYSYNKKNIIDYKESTFCLDKEETLKNFIFKNNCEIKDTILQNNKVKLKIWNNDLNLEYKVEYDEGRNRVWVKYYFITPVGSDM